MTLFNLQGHRGARGLKPENTLPSFEAALDCGVTSLETDLHLTADGFVVLHHDPRLTPGRSRRVSGTVPEVEERPLLSQLTAEDLRSYRVDVVDTQRFPRQNKTVTPLAETFCFLHDLDPFEILGLYELFEFVGAYAGKLGAEIGKSESQREVAGRVLFDLELKRVPARPENIGDDFEGTSVGKFEQAVLDVIDQFPLARERVTVRSFDHRSVRCLRQAAPELTGAVLLPETCPLDPVALTTGANATIYAPDHRFLTADQVRQLHEAKLRVIPWTVNQRADWRRLLDLDVDGLTTDYPDELARLLTAQGIAF